MQLKNPVFYPVGASPAIGYAAKALEYRGCLVAKGPDEDVTHLLLPVPWTGAENLTELLAQLPEDVTIFGGKLPDLEGYIKEDFLKDERYLAENAAITAHCALSIATEHLPITLDRCPALIIGWGRIGKCLAQLLKASGANVTVAARKEMDLAMAAALGYGATAIQGLSFGLMRYRLIFNTVPYPVLDKSQMAHCRKDAVKIDLASVQGIAGDDVICARGLPGKRAPESSGNLIARTAIRLACGKER